MKELFKYVAAILCGVALAACIIRYSGYEKLPAQGSVVVGKVVTADHIFKECMKSEDCRVMASASYYEARNQSDTGVVAVMHVIKNRTEHSKWPNTIKEVVYQKHQFSYLWDGSTKKAMKKEQHKRMAALAHNVLNGVVESPVGNAVFYHKVKMDAYPGWSKRVTKVGVLGDHIFYKL